MKWTVKVVTELNSGEMTVHESAIMKTKEEFIKAAALNMSTEESKRIAKPHPD